MMGLNHPNCCNAITVASSTDTELELTRLTVLSTRIKVQYSVLLGYSDP